MADLDIKFELNPASIFANCPEDPGVYTIEDGAGDVLLIAFANNLTQGVTRHLPENEMRSDEVRERARFFRIFLTEDKGQIPRIFDAYVRQKKRFPAGMPEAPQGSEWCGRPDPGAASRATAPAPAPPPPAPPRARTTGPVSPLPESTLERSGMGEAPRSHEAPVPVDPAGSDPAPRRPGLNVVLLDDDIQVLVLMKEFLELEGHRVYAAANRKMFAEACRVRPLDVLVLDYHIPDVPPEQAIEAAKMINPKVLMLLITGTADKDLAYNLLGQGVRKIFPKPFSMKMLSKAIHEAQDSGAFQGAPARGAQSGT